MQDRVVIVTGASRGTGAVTARRFAEEGADVWLCDVLDEPGTEVAGALVADGHTARYRHLDVTDEKGWESLVAEVVDTSGAVDALVNNAAALHLSAIVDTEVADFERLLHVNVIGPFLGIRAVADQMKRQRAGSIVNIGSIDGLIAHNGVAAYSSSKFALRGLTKTAAIELGEHGIRVNTVCPSGGSFEMIKPFIGVLDIERAMSAPKRSVLRDEADPAQELMQFAEMVVFLASDAGGGCTGGDYPVDRGHTAGYMIQGMPGEPGV